MAKGQSWVLVILQLISFFLFLLQYAGMTSGQAGVLVTVQLFAGGLGGLVGGYVGDFFFKWSRFHGLF